MLRVQIPPNGLGLDRRLTEGTRLNTTTNLCGGEQKPSRGFKLYANG